MLVLTQLPTKNNMAQGITSHVISDSLMRDDAHHPPSGFSSGGKAVGPSVEGSQVSPMMTSNINEGGSGGLKQTVGGNLGQYLSAQRIGNPIGEGKIDSFADSINQNNALNKNPLDAFDGTFIAPVANVNFASQMQQLSLMPAVEIKSAMGAINLEISGNTGIFSQPQQGQGQSQGH